PHLDGLEHDHHQAVATQFADDLLLVAAAGLDADAFDPMPPQPFHQRLVSGDPVVDLQSFGALLERDIEFALAGIDPGTDRGTLAHLRRPFLECEPSVPSTIRVLMKVPIAILLRRSARNGSGGQRSDRSAARPGRPPGPGHSSRNAASLNRRANT